MGTLSFREYVLTHSPEDSAAGDFIMDAKHPTEEIPDAKSWRDVEAWLEGQGASDAAIASARNVWERYSRAKDPIPVSPGTGLTVRHLIELLQNEDPDAQVIKYHPEDDVTASRVSGFSRVSVSIRDRVMAAVMLE